ncbi:MAG: hypothetical protein OXG27_08340 [Chloroflexi bacterium]|nr:hypothetical protein [Chloroflexota bacterium]
MTVRLRRLRARDVASFVVVATVVAVVVVVVGRELGIGREAAAVRDGAGAQAVAERSETELTLTLSAPDICETERGWGYEGEVWVYDDEGEIIGTRSITRGWANIAEIPVRWEVTGGKGPYTLVIDNEKRDGVRAYEGASGTASVSCAPNPGAVSYEDYDQHRWYHTNPEIDSGPKTIRATVTDARGATAHALATVYVVLQVRGARHSDGTGIRLMGGKTYRVEGALYTVPMGVVLQMGSMWEAEGGSGQSIWIAGRDAVLYIDPLTGKELYRAIGSKIIWPERAPEGVDAVRLGDDLDLDPDELIDNGHLGDFVASRGKFPGVSNAQ